MMLSNAATDYARGLCVHVCVWARACTHAYSASLERETLFRRPSSGGLGAPLEWEPLESSAGAQRSWSPCLIHRPDPRPHLQPCPVPSPKASLINLPGTTVASPNAGPTWNRSAQAASVPRQRWASVHPRPYQYSWPQTGISGKAGQGGAGSGPRSGWG